MAESTEHWLVYSTSMVLYPEIWVRGSSKRNRAKQDRRKRRCSSLKNREHFWIKIERFGCMVTDGLVRVGSPV